MITFDEFKKTYIDYRISNLASKHDLLIVYGMLHGFFLALEDEDDKKKTKKLRDEIYHRYEKMNQRIK